MAIGNTLDVSDPAKSSTVVHSSINYLITAASFLSHRSKIMRTHALIRQCIMRLKSSPSDKLRQVFKLIRGYKFDDEYFNKNKC